MEAFFRGISEFSVDLSYLHKNATGAPPIKTVLNWFKPSAPFDAIITFIDFSFW